MTASVGKNPDFYRDPFETYGYGMAAEMARKGDTEAQQSVAVHLLVGRGIGKDEAEAHRWFMMAAENGERFSQYVAGMQLVLGKGTERS